MTISINVTFLEETSWFQGVQKCDTEKRWINLRVHSERNLQVSAIVLQASETNVIKCLTVNKLALPKLSIFPSNLVHQSLTLAPENTCFL